MSLTFLLTVTNLHLLSLHLMKMNKYITLLQLGRQGGVRSVLTKLKGGELRNCGSVPGRDTRSLLQKQ